MSNTERLVLPISVKSLIDDYIYRIDLDADYQRDRIWSRTDQERLLDSIITNIDIPKFYLAQVTGRKQYNYECIDGKQRMTTLLNFFKPEPNDKPLTVKITEEKYTYTRLKKVLPKFAKKIEDFELTFVIYPEMEDNEDFLREIFRRLQLGVRLNSGELLKSYTGAIRDFVFKEIGKDGPFVRHTSLSEKRFSRQFTLAQICINSFNRSKTGEFGRARYEDLSDFFKENDGLEKNDNDLMRIREVLKLMDKHFGDEAKCISSRAVAISAYLFVENLHENDKTPLVPNFVKFYVKMLNEIKANMDLLRRFKTPNNRQIMEEFQKYILQASVEQNSISRRDEFLRKAFSHYLAPKTKGEIVGSK